MLVSITGATGKTGLEVVGAFLRDGHQVRALAHDSAGASRLSAERGAEVVIGDMEDPADLTGLVADCDAVYHIPPNMNGHEVEMARALVEACRRTGTTRLVYHSVLHPQCETMPHHWMKMQVESYLLTSGLHVAFLQPAPYMQNLHPYLQTALLGGVPAFPYGPHVRLSMVDLRDVAAAALVTVVDDRHRGGSFQLCAEDRLTQGSAWEQACEVLGIDVPFRTVSPQRWRRTAGAGLADETADWLMRMFEHYDAYGLEGSSAPLRALLGRPPISFMDHLSDIANDPAFRDPPGAQAP